MEVLHVGDRILAIDGHNLNQEPLSLAISLLQESGDKVQLCIARNNPPANSKLKLLLLLSYISQKSNITINLHNFLNN